MPHGGGVHSGGGHSGGGGHHGGGGGYYYSSNTYYGGGYYGGGYGGGSRGCSPVLLIFVLAVLLIVYFLVMWAIVPNNLSYSVAQDSAEERVDFYFSGGKTSWFSEVSFGNGYGTGEGAAYLFSDFPAVLTTDPVLFYGSLDAPIQVATSGYYWQSFYLPIGSSVNVTYSVSTAINLYIVADWQWYDFNDLGDFTQCQRSYFGSGSSINFTSLTTGQYYFYWDNSWSPPIYLNYSVFGIRYNFDLSNPDATCDFSTCDSLSLPFGKSRYLLLASPDSNSDDGYVISYWTSHRWSFILLLFGGISLALFVLPVVGVMFCLWWSKRSSYTTIS